MSKFDVFAVADTEDRWALRDVGFEEIFPGVWENPVGSRASCEALALAMIGRHEYPWRMPQGCPCMNRGGCPVGNGGAA
jgi:hypothetical protein